MRIFSFELTLQLSIKTTYVDGMIQQLSLALD